MRAHYCLTLWLITGFSITTLMRLWGLPFSQCQYSDILPESMGNYHGSAFLRAVLMILSFLVESSSIHFHLGVEKNMERKEERGKGHSSSAKHQSLSSESTVSCRHHWTSLTTNLQLALNEVVEVMIHLGKWMIYLRRKAFNPWWDHFSFFLKQLEFFLFFVFKKHCFFTIKKGLFSSFNWYIAYVPWSEEIWT